MKITDLFPEVEDINQLKYRKKDSKLMSGDKVVFELNGIDVPEQWVDLAADTLIQKYIRKAQVPTKTTKRYHSGIPEFFQASEATQDTEWTYETSAKQVFHRLAGCWTYWGLRSNYFDTNEDAFAYYKNMFCILYFQMGAPNSPQWFNTGLNWAYGLTGKPQGHYYVENGEVKQSTSAYERPQPHACFIQSVGDDLVNEDGIMDLVVKEARLFKYGSGSGTNYSAIRGKGEQLSGGGKSSGLMSFLKIGDASAGTIKSGGTTRRAARLTCLDLDHPEIEEFIEWKVNEEHKVACLVAGSNICNDILPKLLKNYKDIEKREHYIKLAIKNHIPDGYIHKVCELAEQGHKSIYFNVYTSDWEGEAYQTISGQNSNNSIRMPNEFFDKLNNNPDDHWELKNRTDGAVCRTVPLKDLWNKICKAAWNCADPGLQYDDIINDWNTCIKDARIEASNPCSEYMFLSETACNLASINVMKFMEKVGEEYKFDFVKFDAVCRIWAITLDITVEMSQLPSKKIAENTFKYRTTGLGFANLGATLMKMGIGYDSDEGRGFAACLSSIMTTSSYKASAEMAKELGAFPRYDDNAVVMKTVLYNHCAAILPNAPFKNLSVDPPKFASGCPNKDLYNYAVDIATQLKDSLDFDIKFRNAQVTLIAPTGTIGLVMGCDTTGIEPDYSLVKYKTLAGGGAFKIINESIVPTLLNIGYDPKSAETIKEYALKHNTTKGAPGFNYDKHGHIFQTAGEISYTGHIKMMAAVQPFLSGAISKTINMKANATIDDVKNAYIIAWGYGLKSIALYRDMSKLSQPLSGPSLDIFKKIKADMAVNKDVPKSEIIAKNLLAHISEKKKLPSKRRGYTQKVNIGGANMFLRTGEWDDNNFVGEIFIDMYKEGSSFRSLLNAFCVSISKGLQYGVPLEAYIEAFVHTKFEPMGVVRGHDRIKMASSILDLIFRDLAINYLDRDDLANVSPEETQEIMDEKHIESEIQLDDDDKDTIYLDEQCPNCRQMKLVYSGTCKLCHNCKETTGCS